METKLFTFVRIADGDKVVVLDKVVREGWEGLTFPGGKVEKNESVRASAIREVREETGLSVDVRYRGLLRNMGAMKRRSFSTTRRPWRGNSSSGRTRDPSYG